MCRMMNRMSCLSTDMGRANEIPGRDPREIPKGQIKVTDKICKRCIYHSAFGVGERLIACMYADKEHHCRSLEPDYLKGYCKYYKKGKRLKGNQFNNKNLYIDMPGRALHER